MHSLAPLTAAPAYPRLAPWASAPLRWWIYRPECGAFQDAGSVIGALERRGAIPTSPWLAHVDGRPEDLRYVADVTGGGLRQPAVSGSRPSLIGHVDDRTAAVLLDATQAAAASVVLLSVDDDHLTSAETDLFEVSTDGGPTTGGASSVPPVPRIVVFCPAGSRWIVFGCPGDQPPPIPAAASTEPEPPPASVSHAGHQHNVARPRRALALAALLALAASGVVSWRSLATRSPTPSVAASVPGRSIGSPPGPVVNAVLTPSMLPTPRLSPSIVYDRAHAQTLLFGVLGPPGSTWLWTHGDWSQVQTPVSPPERFGAAASYDPEQGRVVVFGEGQEPGEVPGDTWSWDGRSWSRIDGIPGGPPGFQGAGMAFDEARGVMVLVTPMADQRAGMETWTLAGSRWVTHGPATLPPQSRPIMAFDHQTGSVLMVIAGQVAGVPARTWSWDGRWRELHPQSEPPGGAGGFMTTDPLSGRLLLLTPSAQGGFPLQTWAWDGRDWSQQHPATNPRGVMGVATDLQAGVALAFGFARPGAPGSLNAVWAWSGATWVQLAATPPPGVTETIASPPPRGQAWLAYDEADARLVLFGGLAEPGRPLSDTWLWDGSRWSGAPGAGGPPAGGPMAFDPVTRSVLLVSESVGARGMPVLQTWAWNGSSWRRLLPTREISSSLSVVAIERDPAAGQMVAVGLCCVGADGRPSTGPRLQTWTWNGSTWTRAHPATELSGGGRVEMAYEGASHRLIAVVAAGWNSPATTWAWDGSTWAQLRPTVPTGDAAPGMTMAYDPSTGSVVILDAAPPASGEAPSRALVAVWSAGAWTAVVDPVGSPAVDTTMHATRVFFEPHIGRLVVLGSPEHDYSRVWMWTGRSWLELDAPHL